MEEGLGLLKNSGLRRGQIGSAVPIIPTVRSSTNWPTDGVLIHRSVGSGVKLRGMFSSDPKRQPKQQFDQEAVRMDDLPPKEAG